MTIKIISNIPERPKIDDLGLHLRDKKILCTENFCISTLNLRKIASIPIQEDSETI